MRIINNYIIDINAPTCRSFPHALMMHDVMQLSKFCLVIISRARVTVGLNNHAYDIIVPTSIKLLHSNLTCSYIITVVLAITIAS